jgi:hypothetical protein
MLAEGGLPMLKGYISRIEGRTKPGQTPGTDYLFTSNPNSAMHWETKEAALWVCTDFNDGGISIPSALGGTYVCKNFEPEQRKPHEFVISCEAPFIPVQAEF